MRALPCRTPPTSIITMKCLKALELVAASACIAWLGLFTVSANASVVIGSTRAVYPSNETEITLRLTNEGRAPALVQSWVDDGDAQKAPSDLVVPFTITPPISRIDPSKSQTLRIVHTGEPLPQNRESVFWINVLEVPPKPGEALADSNLIQMAFRSRIKLFYRPDGLKGSSAEAPAQLVWRLARGNAKPAVVAHNSSAFHVSLTEIRVESGAHSATSGTGGMVAPGETLTFELDGNITGATGASVHFTSLSDYGGAITNKAPLLPGNASP